MTPTRYAQVRFSRTDGRSWDTGYVGQGASAVDEARDMARTLTASPAMDYVEVVIETREGAVTTDTAFYRWSRANGWH
jgi:hypothetical protein